MITHLEIVMAQAIRSEFGLTQGWLKRLTEDRRRKLHAVMLKADQEDGFVNALLFTQFADKVTILRKSPSFEFGKSEFERELRGIGALRDLLAHANDYAATPDAACSVCSNVRLIEKWNTRLFDWPLKPHEAAKGLPA